MSRKTSTNEDNQEFSVSYIEKQGIADSSSPSQDQKIIAPSPTNPSRPIQNNATNWVRQVLIKAANNQKKKTSPSHQTSHSPRRDEKTELTETIPILPEDADMKAQLPAVKKHTFSPQALYRDANSAEEKLNAKLLSEMFISKSNSATTLRKYLLTRQSQPRICLLSPISRGNSQQQPQTIPLAQQLYEHSIENKDETLKTFLEREVFGAASDVSKQLFLLLLDRVDNYLTMQSGSLHSEALNDWYNLLTTLQNPRISYKSKLKQINVSIKYFKTKVPQYYQLISQIKYLSQDTLEDPSISVTLLQRSILLVQQLYEHAIDSKDEKFKTSLEHDVFDSASNVAKQLLLLDRIDNYLAMQSGSLHIKILNDWYNLLTILQNPKISYGSKLQQINVSIEYFKTKVPQYYQLLSQMKHLNKEIKEIKEILEDPAIKSDLKLRTQCIHRQRNVAIEFIASTKNLENNSHWQECAYQLANYSSALQNYHAFRRLSAPSRPFFLPQPKNLIQQITRGNQPSNSERIIQYAGDGLFFEEENSQTKEAKRHSLLETACKKMQDYFHKRFTESTNQDDGNYGKADYIKRYENWLQILKNIKSTLTTELDAKKCKKQILRELDTSHDKFSPFWSWRHDYADALDKVKDTIKETKSTSLADYKRFIQEEIASYQAHSPLSGLKTFDQIDAYLHDPLNPDLIVKWCDILLNAADEKVDMKSSCSTALAAEIKNSSNSDNPPQYCQQLKYLQMAINNGHIDFNDKKFQHVITAKASCYAAELAVMAQWRLRGEQARSNWCFEDKFLLALKEFHDAYTNYLECRESNQFSANLNAPINADFALYDPISGNGLIMQVVGAAQAKKVWQEFLFLRNSYQDPQAITNDSKDHSESEEEDASQEDSTTSTSSSTTSSSTSSNSSASSSPPTKRKQYSQEENETRSLIVTIIQTIEDLETKVPQPTQVSFWTILTKKSTDNLALLATLKYNLIHHSTQQTPAWVQSQVHHTAKQLTDETAGKTLKQCMDAALNPQRTHRIDS